MWKNRAQAPGYVDGLYQMEALDELLPQADIVARTLPGTDETRHLMDRARFMRMKPGAYLVTYSHRLCYA